MNKQTQTTKKYYIRVSIADTDNMESEVGLIAFDWYYYTVSSFSLAAWFDSYESAFKAIKKIVTEKPCKNVVGETQYPPTHIHHIGNMSFRRQHISFKLSVIEIDISDITMEEMVSVSGKVSFENPEIQITEYTTTGCHQDEKKFFEKLHSLKIK